MIFLLSLLLLTGKASSIESPFSLLLYQNNNTSDIQFIRPFHEISVQDVENTTTIIVLNDVYTLHKLDLSFAPKLHSLYLNNCVIADIKTEAFSKLQELEVLNLSYNNLKIINEDVFNDVPVKHLNLSYNNIQIIKPIAFDNMPNLESISLDFNELSHFYNIDFENCPKLTNISVQYNFITALSSDAFRYLRANPLSIYLSYNKISVWHPETFAKQKLVDLYLDHNEVGEINDTLRDLGEMNILNLEGNHIVCLPKNLLDNMKKFKALLAGNNPTSCRCSEEIYEKYKEANVEVTFSIPLNCNYTAY